MKKQKQHQTLQFDKEGVVQAHHYAEKEEPFNTKQFEDNLRIDIREKNQDIIVFDIQGIDCTVANALRRILIAEVPTMAYHKVLLYQNTSVIPDEVLVHRIGLIPIRVEASQFKFRREDDPLDATNSLKFELRVKCVKKEKYAKMSDQELEQRNISPNQYLENAEVFAHQLKWIPQGSQAEQFQHGIQLVHPNIPVAKLRENQEIILEVFAEKGIGRNHAKWSPVSTAFYRLEPAIRILPTFNHDKAEKLVKKCPVGVFDIEDGKAIVKNSRRCTVCRQCLDFQGIQLGKNKYSFIFTIQSTGIYKPTDLFFMALDIFEEKAKSYIL